jgi:hypothetical protein
LSKFGYSGAGGVIEPTGRRRFRGVAPKSAPLDARFVGARGRGLPNGRATFLDPKQPTENATALGVCWVRGAAVRPRRAASTRLLARRREAHRAPTGRGHPEPPT